MVATAAMLDKPDVVAYVGQNAGKFGLDPAAVLAVANHEGLNTKPGTTWVLPKESGFNFGPPSWYSGGAGGPIVTQQGGNASYWAWTPAGLDYWMQKVAESGAAGLTGVQAITAIVKNFERPRADLVSGEIINASKDYNSFLQQIQGQLPGATRPIPVPGGTQLPTPTNPEQTGSTPTKADSNFSMHLFDTPAGPINFTLPWDFSGILLFLAAIFCIIIGALLWDKSRNVIIQGGQTAAMAAA